MTFSLDSYVPAAPAFVRAAGGVFAMHRSRRASLLRGIVLPH
jgi:hypothetical protein